MGRKLRGALSIALALSTTLAMGACGSKQQGNANETSTGEVQVAEAKTSVYEGTLLTAYDRKVVLSGADGDMEFVTSDATLYKTGDEGQMYLDDIVSVTYHAEAGVNYADEIDLVEHMDTAIEFAGVLVDSGDDFITLVNNKLSATFLIDEDSYIVGDLSKGDQIELTYLGDLSDYPYANVVAVVKEVELPKTTTISGIVSEISGRTVLVGIDSAHAYRFVVTDKTDISGAADHIKVGDQIEVTFEGKIESQPDALGIKVVKSTQVRAYTINGTIVSADKGSVTLDTGKGKYAFSTTDSTRYHGEKPAKGYKAEITYTGELSGKPQACVISCTKSPKDAKQAAAKKDADKKKAEEAKKAEEERKKKEEEAKKAEEEKKKEEEAKKAEEEKKEETTKPEEDEAVEPTTEPETTEPTTEPETVEPTTEPETVEPTTEPETTEPTTEPETTEPTTEPETTEPTTEPETTEPETTEPTTEPQTEEEVAQTDPDMGVCGQGTIVKGDEKKKTVEIELKDGKKITLEYDKDTKIAAGYIPEKGDVVKIEYGSTSKKLKSIQLVSRPEAEPEATAETGADEG